MSSYGIPIRRKYFVILGAFLLLALVYGCSGGNGETPAADGQPDVKQMVEDFSTDRLTAESASITSRELIVTNGGKKKTYALPEDIYFVSIAPYVEATHPCEIHSLTGCQGELVSQTFDVRVEDADGTVVIDDAIASYSNGFIDLWLPRDRTYRVTITQDGRSAEAEIGTFDGDGTCITTMQLS